jgi:hypothetical protein
MQREDVRMSGGRPLNGREGVEEQRRELQISKEALRSR